MPISRLPAEFFDLSTGKAGEIIRKSLNYNIRLAIIGNVETYISSSKAFADFVRETNQGEYVWFLADEDTLMLKLGNLTL